MNENSPELENLLKARRDYLQAKGIPDYAADYIRVGGTHAFIELHSSELENPEYKPHGWEHDPDAPLAKLAMKRTAN